MDRSQVAQVSDFLCWLGALVLMLTVAGCTTWSAERQKHYSWLYEKCMRGEHEPYTIHMNSSHSSPQPQRCLEEYNHYVGTTYQAL